MVCQSRWQHNVVTTDDLDEVAQGRPDTNFVQRHAGVVGHEVLQIGAELLPCAISRHRAESQHLFGDEMRILLHDAEQQCLHLIAQIFFNAPHHAAIDHTDDIARQQDEVSRMRIGMVKAIAEDHFEIHVRSTSGELAQVLAALLQGLHITAEHAFQPLHRHHLMRAKMRKRLRDAHGGIIREVAAEFFEVLPLVAEIEFPQQRAAKLTHERQRLVSTQGRGMLLQQFRQRLHDLQIRGRLLCHACTPHFDYHTLPGGQQRRMHLRHGSCCKRFILKAGKQLRDGSAEFAFDRGPRHLCRIGRHVGLQLRKLLRHFRAHEVCPCAEHLPQLDEGGAQLRQRHSHPRRLRHTFRERFAIRALQAVLQPRILEAAEKIRQPIAP
jgi:hypothetical protein